MNDLAQTPGQEALPVVLFVDDDASNRQAFHSAFRHQMVVLLAADYKEAMMHLNARRVHVLIADQRMHGLNGSELLAIVKERFPEVRRMLITAYSDLEAVIDAVNNGGVSKYFSKPWVASQLVRAVDDAYNAYKSDEEKEAYTRRLEESNRQLEFALRQRLLS